MHETTPQHERTSNAQEALTHADSTVRTTRAGIASAALAVRRALQCVLRATPWKAAKASGCSFTAFSQVEKRGLKCTGCSAALRGQAAGWENQGLPARVGSSQEGRIWAVLSPGRAGGSGRWGGRCWEQCWWCWRSLAGSRRPSTVKPAKLDSYGGASLIGALSSSNLQIHAICTFRHNLFETGRRTEPLERGTHRHRHA